MDHKPKPIFTQNEHGKFENRSCESPMDVDIDQLKRENQVLKEKLSAIRSESEVKPRVTISTDMPRHIPPPKSPDPYCCPPSVIPCNYNPLCYSRNRVPHDDIIDRLEHEYLLDMMHRCPDYYPYAPYSPVARTKSCEDLNRLLWERDFLYHEIGRGRPRSRTRSVDGFRPSSGRPASGRPSSRSHSRTRSYEDPGISFRCDEDPYFLERWKHTGGLLRVPFRPRSTLDISVGMKVSLHRSDGRLSRGIVRWIGLLPNLPGEYIGVELETQTGKHDGYLNGIRYFKCRENCGIFVKFTKIIMAWR